MAGAALMLAHQVAGKAARDGLFLSQYAPTDLPRIVSAAALFALLTGYFFSLLMERVGPRRLMPAAFGISGVLQLCEFVAYDIWPGITAVVIYLHIVGFGAILLSGFWSLVNELFDPREARKYFGAIAGTGTAGGIAGGVLAERVSTLVSAPAVLLVLALLHFGCAWILSRLGPGEVVRRAVKPAPLRSAGELFRQSPYLWNLAALVLLGTASAAILDYLFKSNAAATFGKGPALVRFFAIFYTTSQVLTFAVQSLLSSVALNKLGLARTVSSLPLATGAGSLTALLIPLFPAIASVRSLELILRGSLFRSGYELFFTPVPPADKRAVKTIVDVGCDRLGDAFGSGLIQLAIFLGPAMARAEILSISMVLSGICVWLAFRLDRAYVAVLEQGLITRAAELDLADVQDPGTLSVVLNSLPAMPISRAAVIVPAETRSGRLIVDPELERLSALRSGDAAKVTASLNGMISTDALLVPQLIRLLAWDEVADNAKHLLVRSGAAITGQLVDAMLRPEEDFTIRRRIPRILARTPIQRSVDGLVDGLRDPRFEVRFQCGRALDQLMQSGAGLVCPADRIYAAVERELAAGRPIWEGHRLLDRRDSGEGYLFLDDLLSDRSNHLLEHIFSLLAIVLPREPVKVAFRALHTDDKLLRGLALEYLDSVVPDGIRKRLPDLADGVPAAPRPSASVAAELLRSSDSVAALLKKTISSAPAPAGTQSTATARSG